MRDINGPSSLGVKSGVTKSSDEEPIHKGLLMFRNPDKSFGPINVLQGVNFTVKSQSCHFLDLSNYVEALLCLRKFVASGVR